MGVLGAIVRGRETKATESAFSQGQAPLRWGGCVVMYRKQRQESWSVLRYSIRGSA